MYHSIYLDEHETVDVSLHFKASHRLASLHRYNITMCMHISWHSIDTLLTHRNIVYGSGLLHRESILVAYGAPQHQLSSCTGGTGNEEWGMKVYFLITETFLCSLHCYTFRQPESECLSKICQIPGPINIIQSPTKLWNTKALKCIIPDSSVLADRESKLP